MSDNIWVCRMTDRVIPEWLAKEGDDWNSPQCRFKAAPKDWPQHRKGHEECGFYQPYTDQQAADYMREQYG